MRTVLFKEWIDRTREIPGYFTDEQPGLFHEWGLDNDDEGSYTVAIVEKEDGSVTLALPKNIKFTDKFG